MNDDDLKGMFDALRRESAEAHADTRRLFAETAERIAAENRHFFATGSEALRADTSRLFAETAERIAAENRQFFATGAEALRADTSRLFAETAERIAAENRQFFATGVEALRHEIQLVAEGVSGVAERLTRETADIRDEMRRGFAETQAMIRFPHAELDRRLRA